MTLIRDLSRAKATFQSRTLHTIFTEGTDMKSNLIDIEARLVHQTEKAWLLDINGDDEPVWIPKSAAEFDDGVLTLPEPLALEKGLT